MMFDGWNSLGLWKLLGHTMLDNVSVFFFFFFLIFKYGVCLGLRCESCNV